MEMWRAMWHQDWAMVELYILEANGDGALVTVAGFGVFAQTAEEVSHGHGEGTHVAFQHVLVILDRERFHLACQLIILAVAFFLLSEVGEDDSRGIKS